MSNSANDFSVTNISQQRVTRAVVWNQALWTAGYSLTSGGFLTYFGAELGAQGFLMALLLATPETVGVFGLLTRWAIHRIGNRKRVWIGFSLAARCCSLGILLLAFPAFRPDSLNPLWLMIGFLAVAQAFQSIAYVAYLSWLADLVPEQNWGRFFAKRNVSKLCVLLIVPVAGGLLRDWWRKGLTPDLALWAYVAAFAVGIVLLLVSMIPLLRLPNVQVRSNTVTVPNWQLMANALRDRSVRFLLIHGWWLALANGLTQAAFFLYMFRTLEISLTTYYILANVMYLVGIPVSIAAGIISDRFGNKPLLFWGVVAVSFSMPFWLLATPDQWWWLFGAYSLWGMFAGVNIAGRNLMLKLAPRSDNSAHLALFRQVSGLLAGLSGLLGGLWLDRLLDANFGVNLLGYRVGSFQLLFLVSWFGRFTAALWLLPIREHPINDLEFDHGNELTI